MFEIEKNKEAWSLLSEDHYNHFKQKLSDKNFQINPIISDDLGDIKGKKILHLQCNTGADSILLARKGAIVTGVDLSPKNIFFAKKLAAEFEIKNIDFIASDILKLTEIHNGEYDIVFTSDGAIGWIPDLNKWAETIRHFLKKEGYFYLHDSHPTFLIFDENKLLNNEISIKYPYFDTETEKDDSIGGYASDSKPAEVYFWSYKMSDIINALSKADIYIFYLNEYDRCAQGMGGIKSDNRGLYYYPKLEGYFPITMSIKAKIK